MPNQICIITEKIKLTATLDESETAKAIWENLPMKSNVNRWGDEIYFPIPVNLDESAEARQDMEVGELGYWPEGSAFCIFFGPTPVSQGDRPRAYSNVNPFGMIDGDATALHTVQDGEAIEIIKA
jgi:hypothetical protein